ncbi:MAG: response regulator [Kiloniellales bacterium]|nr:response regulator [Kiloniellales bacterium]
MTDITIESKGRVYIVDDDEAVRDSLAAFVDSLDLDTEIFLFGSGEEFLDAVEEDAMGCALLDVRMPGLSGLEVQKILKDRGSDLAVVIITGHGDVSMAVQAMRAGAFHFIEKPFTDESLVETLHQAVRASLSARKETLEREEAKARLERLTPRESDVLQQLVLGNPNKVIAYELGISARTVEVHRARVMEKLEAPNLSSVIKLALAAGVSNPTRDERD